jgi:hypothetical protein
MHIHGTYMHIHQDTNMIQSDTCTYFKLIFKLKARAREQPDSELTIETIEGTGCKQRRRPAQRNRLQAAAAAGAPRPTVTPAVAAAAAVTLAVAGGRGSGTH